MPTVPISVYKNRPGSIFLEFMSLVPHGSTPYRTSNKKATYAVIIKVKTFAYQQAKYKWKIKLQGKRGTMRN